MSSKLSNLLERAKRLESSINNNGIPIQKKNLEALSTLSTEFNENIITERITDPSKTNAQLFLASKGFEADKLNSSVENATFRNTEEPMSQLDAADINGYLQHHHQLIIHSALENAKKESLSKSTTVFDDYISNLWNEQRQAIIKGSGWKRNLKENNASISNSLNLDNPIIPEIPFNINNNSLSFNNMNNNNNGFYVNPSFSNITLSSQYTDQMKSYGNVIKDICRNSTGILNKPYPLINKLISSQNEGNDVELSFCWRLMKYYFDETKEEIEKGYYKQFLENNNYENILSILLNNSIKCLEDDYFNLIKRKVIDSPTYREDGGELSDFDIIYDYTSLLLSERKKIGFNITTTRVDDVALWEMVFYSLRCGKINVAIDILIHNKPKLLLIEESSNVIKALKMLENFPSSLNVNDLKVFTDLQSYLASLNQKQDVDSYLIGVLSIICFSPIKNKDIKNMLYPTIQDYYYNQLYRICHPLTKHKHQFLNEYNKLVDFTMKLGSSHFSSKGRKPLIYFEVLLLLCRFEDAINYLVQQQNTNLAVEAVHFGIVLHYYGVLSTCKENRKDDSFLVDNNNNNNRPSLVLIDIIMLYIEAFNNIDPLLSALYLYVIESDNIEELSESLVKLVLNTSSCEMFYDNVDPTGKNKKQSILFQLLNSENIYNIINYAGSEYERRGSYHKSIELYIVSENWNRILELLNYEICQCLKYGETSDGNNWIIISRNIAYTYFQETFIEINKDLLRTFEILLNLSIYFECFNNGNWLKCIEIMDELNILPTTMYSTDAAVQCYRNFDKHIQYLIDKIIDSYMQVLYHQYEIEKCNNPNGNFDVIKERANSVMTFMGLSGIETSAEISTRINQLVSMMKS